MHSVTLICSAHRARGRCSAENLLGVLRALEPDVIFLEIPPSRFDQFLYGGMLEAEAVARYRDARLCRFAEVDTYQAPLELAPSKSDVDELFDTVRLTSPEYCGLVDRMEAHTWEGGFRYLNSDAAAAESLKLEQLEDDVIRRSANPRLAQTLASWRQLHVARVREMVDNIHDHCRLNSCERGVFLVGAAHRAGVIQEITANADRTAIRWVLSSHEASYSACR